jgi:mannose-6-phosphate isomerase-like protein (cupin superfamily)
VLIKRLKECPEFIAGDNSILRELLHAGKGDFKFGYSLAHAIVMPGTKTRPHRLKTSEVYYIIEGCGIMSIDGETSEVGPGDAVYIPPHATQYAENTGAIELKFLCIVDPAWRAEDEEVI